MPSSLAQRFRFPLPENKTPPAQIRDHGFRRSSAVWVPREERFRAFRRFVPESSIPVKPFSSPRAAFRYNPLGSTAARRLPAGCRRKTSKSRPAVPCPPLRPFPHRLRDRGDTGSPNAVRVTIPAEANNCDAAPMRRIFSWRSSGENPKPKRLGVLFALLKKACRGWRSTRAHVVAVEQEAINPPQPTCCHRMAMVLLPLPFKPVNQTTQPRWPLIRSALVAMSRPAHAK